MSLKDISLISGGFHTDQRGALSFFNDFDMSNVKRFYIIEHPDTNIIRAWQGHRHEQKWFSVISGAFKMAVIKPDDWQHPSKDLMPEIYTLSADNPQVLHVPSGYATGFRALAEHSKLLVFSDATLQDSMKDDYRFDKDYWPTSPLC